MLGKLLGIGKLFFGRAVAARAISVAVPVGRGTVPIGVAVARAVAVAPVLRRLGGLTVAGTVRRVVRRAVALLVTGQLFVHGLLRQSEDLADAVVEPLGIVDQAEVEFDFEIHVGTAGAVMLSATLWLTPILLLMGMWKNSMVGGKE